MNDFICLSVLQICVPMSAEFEEMSKQRENSNEEPQSELKTVHMTDTYWSNTFEVLCESFCTHLI